MADKSMDGLNTFTDQSGAAAVDTTKKMRIGIIGCGWIADAHAKSYLNQPDVEIVAGAEWVVVEQDNPSMGLTPMESIAKSREYLKTLGY